MIDYSEILRLINSRQLEGPYLFMGEEGYLMEDIIERLIKKFVNPTFIDLNYSKLEGKNIDLEDLITTCETLPFMSDKKIVVLDNVSSFISNIDKNQDKLYKYLDNLGEYLILIFLDSDNQLKKNMRIYKYFNKNNRYVNFGKLYGPSLNKWVLSIVNKNGKSINNANINYFIQKSSYNSRNIDISLYELSNELNKVINHAKGTDILKEDIDSVLTDNIDTNIFELLDAITRLDTSRALSLFEDMYNSNEPIQRIFYMITRQIRLIYGYKLYSKKGYSPSMTQKKLKIGSYEYNKIKNQSRNFSETRLKNIMNELLNMDIKMKTTSSSDKILMEMFIVSLCNY